jgi:flavin reductase (DIM6/NTAB) family NADH-FMN oxidoreductase RutF
MIRSISDAAFREALSHFASGVTIVTSRAPSGPVGFTATGFTSLSLTPPLILVCISKTASAFEGVVGADRFGVSVLGEGQGWIAEQFARSGIDRFRDVPLSGEPATTVPLIEGALARLECHRHAQHDAGDHTILIGRVAFASVGAGLPLVHFRRRFGAFVAEEAAREAQPSRAAKEGTG